MSSECFAPRNRRAFLRDSSLFLLAAGFAGDLFAADDAKPELRIGLITDLHYADKPASGTRFYRETLSKLEAAVEQFKIEQPKLVVELGDLIDNGEGPQDDLKFLKQTNDLFSKI